MWASGPAPILGGDTIAIRRDVAGYPPDEVTHLLAHPTIIQAG